MNPLTNVRNLAKLNERELEMGIAGNTSKSWHQKYKDSAWIFVGGLPYDLSEGDVICVFSQYGEVVNLNMVRDRKTGKTRGFCFLCYEDQRSTVLAVDNFNGIKLLNRVIRVDHVEEYRVPKEHGDEDEDIRKVWNEGCAPAPIKTSDPNSEDELLPVKEEVPELEPKLAAKKEKKLKKVKKEKKAKKKNRKDSKKKKKKRHESSESSSSDSESEEKIKRKRIKVEPSSESMERSEKDNTIRHPSKTDDRLIPHNDSSERSYSGNHEFRSRYDAQDRRSDNFRPDDRRGIERNWNESRHDNRGRLDTNFSGRDDFARNEQSRPMRHEERRVRPGDEHVQSYRSSRDDHGRDDKFSSRDEPRAGGSKKYQNDAYVPQRYK